MLNEVFTIQRSLGRYNAAGSAVHPWVKRLGRAPLLIVGLRADAQAATIELRGKEEAAKVSKIQQSYHSNFPALNYGGGIWRLDSALLQVKNWREEKSEASPADRLRLLKAACFSAELAPEAPKFFERVKGIARQLKSRFVSAADEFEAFRILLDRFVSKPVGTEAWFRGLTDSLLAWAEDGDLSAIERVERLLEGDESKKTTILFDLADCVDYECRVADPRMADFYSRRLFQTEPASTERGVCALTGDEVPIETEKLPNPLLPVLGNAYLMAMNADTPCQHRYGKIGPAIFPVGKPTAESMYSGILQITAVSREHRNWQRVPDSSKGKSNLLIAYLRDAPLLDAELADLFSDPESAEASYEDISAKVFRTLQGRESSGSDLVELLVLNRISKGQVQVELSRSLSADQVFTGGRQWQDGARNRPEVAVPLLRTVPFPADVMRCTQTLWIRGGKEAVDARGCDLSEVYDLLIADMPGAMQSASRLLELLTARAGPLLVALGHARRLGGKNIWKGFAKQASACASTAIAAMAIALKKLNLDKEDYMKHEAFLLGRFLSLVDTLHHQYCLDVRKGQAPPQLLGSSLIPTVVADANKGLAHVLDRIRIYRDWATRAGTPLARWTLGQIGEIARPLSEALPSRRLEAAEKAQLLLGYLASAERKDETETEFAGEEKQ